PVEPHALFQHPTRRLDCAALDLVADPVGIDGLADIGREPQPFDADIRIALDLGHRRAIGAGVLVAGITDAIADARLFRRLPVRALRRGADHVPAALIAEMPQAE